MPWGSLARTELRLHWRHGLLTGTAAMTVLWSMVLLALPEGWRSAALPWILFLDLAALGFFFVPALAVVERSNGVTAALRLTMLPAAAALAMRVTVLAAAAVTAALLLATVADTRSVAAVLGGAALTSALLSLLAVVMVGREDTLTAYMARVPVVAVPLLLPAIISAVGVWDSPILAWSPATGALQMLSGEWSWRAAAWIAAWLAVLGVLAARVGFEVEPRRGGFAAHRRRTLTRLPGTGAVVALRSFARVDRRTLLGDRLLVLLVVGVPLVALVARGLAGPGVAWIKARYDIDLTPHLPVVWALLVVVHTPTVFGALAGLLFLEDRDAGLLPAIAVTPAALTALLRYRLAAAAFVSATGVIVGMALAGATHPAGVPGLLATAGVAGAVAIVPALLMATVVRDRAQGMALMKALSLPLYLPLAWWFVDAPTGWLFSIIPSAWSVRALWAPSAAQAMVFAAGGVAAVAGLSAVLIPRLRRSVVG